MKTLIRWLKSLFNRPAVIRLMPGPERVVEVPVEKIVYVDRVEVQEKIVVKLRALNEEEQLKLDSFDALYHCAKLTIDMMAGRISQDLLSNRVKHLVKDLEKKLEATKNG